MIMLPFNDMKGCLRRFYKEIEKTQTFLYFNKIGIVSHYLHLLRLIEFQLPSQFSGNSINYEAVMFYVDMMRL